MLKKLVFSLVILASTSAFAGEVAVEKTEQSVNGVVAMKSIANGAINIFLVDQQEPAARPYKVVVSLPIGGEEITEFGAFSAGSYCGVKLDQAQVKKLPTKPWATYQIAIPVTHYDGSSCSVKDTLTLEARLMDDSESSLKASTSKQN